MLLIVLWGFLSYKFWIWVIETLHSEEIRKITLSWVDYFFAGLMGGVVSFLICFLIWIVMSYILELLLSTKETFLEEFKILALADWSTSKMKWNWGFIYMNIWTDNVTTYKYVSQYDWYKKVESIDTDNADVSLFDETDIQEPKIEIYSVDYPSWANLIIGKLMPTEEQYSMYIPKGSIVSWYDMDLK